MASSGSRESSEDRTCDDQHAIASNQQRKPSLASWPSSDSRSSTSSSDAGNAPGQISISSPQVFTPPSSVDASPQDGIQQESTTSGLGLKAPTTCDASFGSDVDSARTPTRSFSSALADAQVNKPAPQSSSTDLDAVKPNSAHDASKKTADSLWQTDDLLSPLVSTSPSISGAPFTSSRQERSAPRRQTGPSSASKDHNLAHAAGTASSGSLLSRSSVSSPPTGSPRPLNSHAAPWTPGSLSPPAKAQEPLAAVGSMASGAFGIVRGSEQAEDPLASGRRSSVSSNSHRSSGFQPLTASSGVPAYHNGSRIDEAEDSLPDLPSFSSPSSSSSLNSAAAAFSPLTRACNTSSALKTATPGSSFAPFGSRKNSLPITSDSFDQQPGTRRSNALSNADAGTSLGLSNIALPSHGLGRVSRSQSLTTASASAPLPSSGYFSPNPKQTNHYDDPASARTDHNPPRRAYQQQPTVADLQSHEVAVEGPDSIASEYGDLTRARSWSETGALGVITGHYSEMMDRQSAAGYAPYGRQMPARYRDGADAAIPPSASASWKHGYHYGLQSGPPSISDGSTDRGVGQEEINTIFVVGFPEDIQEREFINMFIFARGFEAATLKIPASTAAARERDAAAAAAVSAIAATLPQYPGTNLDGYATPGSAYGGNSYEQALYEGNARAPVPGSGGNAAAVAAVAEGAQRVSSALAAAALSASASSSSLPALGRDTYSSYPSAAGGKKQIIGFAKFRTRDDAMEARDALSGRRIDGEKNSVLKAEMAKKNLHIKRGPGDGMFAPVFGQGPEFQPQPTGARGSSSALDRLAEQDREWRARMAAQGHQPQPTGRGVPASGRGSFTDQYGYSGSLPDQPGQSVGLDNEAAWSAFHSVPSTQSTGVSNALGQSVNSARGSPEDETGYLGLAIDRTPSAATIARNRSSTAGSGRLANFAGTGPIPLGGGKTLLQQLEEQEEVDLPKPGDFSTLTASRSGVSGQAEHPHQLPQMGSGGIVRRNPPPALPTASLGNQMYIDQDFQSLSLSSSLGSAGPVSPQPPLPSSYAQQQQIAQSFGATGPSDHTPTSAVSGTTNFASQQRQYALVSPTSPTFADFRMPARHAGLGPGARADDNNMPISTLYVGGLPSALPSITSALTPGQLEEKLREVFSTCPGFRRLSFRQKSQGPMCFVEFEDVSFAARALKDMYGHTLNGLVKGGIRLAYSKNPLGIRGPNSSSGPASPPPPISPYFASDMFGALASPGHGHAATTPTMAQTMAQIQEMHLQQLQLQQQQQKLREQQAAQYGWSSLSHAHQQQAGASQNAASPPPTGSFSPFGN